jgi:hypothetical protein
MITGMLSHWHHDSMIMIFVIIRVMIMDSDLQGKFQLEPGVLDT